MHHLDHKVSRTGRVVRSAGWEAFLEGPLDNVIGVAGGRVVALCLQGRIVRSKGALPGQLAVDSLPGLEALGGVDQRPCRAGVDGDAAEIAGFEGSNGVECDLGLPGVGGVWMVG